MDRLHAIEVFIAVAAQGSFSGAARSMHMSPPAVTRAIAALEDRLGTPLLIRTTRSVTLTDAGTRFLGDAQQIVDDLAAAENAALGLHASPQGLVRITAPALFGRIYIAPLLGPFLAAHPRLEIETLFVDRVVNLMDEGLDIAIRIGPLPDSSLSAIKVGAVCPVVVAAPSYWQAHDRPTHPKQLQDHSIVQPDAFTPTGRWAFKQADGAPLTVTVPTRLKVNSNDAVIEIIKSGHGVSRLLTYQVAGCINDGSLEPVLNDFAPASQPIHIMHREGRAASSKVRSLVDYLTNALRADMSLHQTMDS